MLTGFPCPGCGITKSIVFLYDGDLSRSLYYHIFGVPVVMFSLALLLLLPIELASGKEYFNSIFYSRKLGIGLGVLLVAYHLVRLVFFVIGHSWFEIAKESIWF